MIIWSARFQEFTYVKSLKQGWARVRPRVSRDWLSCMGLEGWLGPSPESRVLGEDKRGQTACSGQGGNAGLESKRSWVKPDSPGLAV